MPENNEQLYRITDRILSAESDPGQLRDSCHELYELFAKLSGFSETQEKSEDTAETILESGKAISPLEAARCVWDFARTTAFLRGVNAAILELQKRFPGERLEILYAGCGPFATLITPLLERFKSDELCVTLLDYHQRSLDSVREIQQQLSLEEFIGARVQTDAVHYQHPVKPHLVICEVMQKALEKEPQVAATRNLAPQVAENGIFIPESIRINACLANAGEKLELGKMLELDAQMIGKDPAMALKPVTIEIPYFDAGEPDLMLLTTLKVFGTFGLGDYDSAITYPTRVTGLPGLTEGIRIEFSYVEGERPHLAHRFIPGR